MALGLGTAAHAVEPAPPPAAPTPVTEESCALFAEKNEPPPELTKKDEKQLRGHLEASRDAYQKSDYGRAIAELRGAYALKPVGEVVYSVAQACREAGKDAGALALYQQALRIDIEPSLKNDCKRHIEELHGKLAETEAQRAQKLLEQKNYDAAIAAWQAAFKLKGDAGYVFGQAEAYRLSDRNDQALEAYDRFIVTDPNHARVADAKRELTRIRSNREDARASQLSVNGEHLKSAVAWDAAYQIDPRPLFLFRGAESLYRAGQLRESLASHRRFLREVRRIELPAEITQSEARIAEIEKKLAPVPVYKKAWFWGVIAGSAVVVGTAVGLGVGLSRPDPLAGVPDGFRQVID